MNRTFPITLKIIGIPISVCSWLLTTRLVWEQTALSWERGPQMVGFSLMHSGLGVLLILAQYLGILWLVVFLIVAARRNNLGGKLGKAILMAYILALGLLATPYGFWQRLFIDKFSHEHAIEFYTYAAATGDLRTVQAFLSNGVGINEQGRNGAALHGAAVEGELEVIEHLIAHGANVNAINAYGDTPMAYALTAKNNAKETRALLARHGGKFIRGTEARRAD
jgi:Ankyrin repeats (3 copies)